MSISVSRHRTFVASLLALDTVTITVPGGLAAGVVCTIVTAAGPRPMARRSAAVGVFSSTTTSPPPSTTSQQSSGTGGTLMSATTVIAPLPPAMVSDMLLSCEESRP